MAFSPEFASNFTSQAATWISLDDDDNEYDDGDDEDGDEYEDGDDEDGDDAKFTSNYTCSSSSMNISFTNFIPRIYLSSLERQWYLSI